MKLSEVAFDDIKIGMQVFSEAAGFGRVTETKLTGTNGIKNVHIVWADDSTSDFLHSYCDRLEVISGSILDRYFNTNALIKPTTPEEVVLVLEEIRLMQEQILRKFKEIENQLRDGNEK